MTRHLHEPANALLYRALDLPADERQQYLADACEGDAELLELVRTLLARIEELDEFIESPLEALAAPQSLLTAPQAVGKQALLEPEQPLPDEPNRADIATVAVGSNTEGELDVAGGSADAAAAPERGLWQRRPGAMAAATLCACALVLVTSAALWHARQSDQARAAAEQRVQQSGKPARATKIDSNATLAKIPAAARDKFVAAAQSYQAQLADVLRAGGDLQGAQQAALLSLDFAKKQLQSHPDDARWRGQLSAAHGQAGTILVEQGFAPEGLAELRKALAMRQEVAAQDAGNEPAARELADAYGAIGNALMGTMDYAGAEREFAAARAIYAAQRRANPTDAGLLAGLIELELVRANVQNLQRHGRDAVQTLASLHALAREANKAGADAYLAVRVALLDAHIQPRGTPAQAYAAGQQALGALLKQTEKDPLDTARLRESAIAWQTTGEIGQRAGQAESACRYLNLAAKRYDEFAKSQRLNAFDKLRMGQLQSQRKACG